MHCCTAQSCNACAVHARCAALLAEMCVHSLSGCAVLHCNALLHCAVMQCMCCTCAVRCIASGDVRAFIKWLCGTTLQCIAALRSHAMHVLYMRGALHG